MKSLYSYYSVVYLEIRRTLQSDDFELFFFGVIIFGFLVYGLYKLISNKYHFNQDGRQARRRTASSPTRRVTPPESQARPIELDTASSPIGDVCMNCGAVFEEEIEPNCPTCGIHRERCPICQRFIAGGQDLLACPFCKTLGHANEMETWVRKKVKCPHCGHRLGPTLLMKPTREPQL